MVKFIRNFFFMLITAFFIIAFYGIISVSLYSQDKSGTVSGTVIDKLSNAAIEGADVTLHKSSDSSLVKGSATDAAGKFTLSGIPAGKYYIKANLVGYSFAVVSGINITPENLTLTLEPVKLSSGSTTTEEIVVEAEKSLIEFRPDKKVFNVSKNMTAQGGTLIDLLKEIPSVTVDQDGNVSLRGGEGVKIMIDGRPSGLDGQNRNLILEQIPASNVESVELITNPSAKYEAEGSVGIINIVLKKSENVGMGYTGNLGLNLGTGDKYTGQFSLSLRNSKFNLSGNYSYNLRNQTSSGFSDLFYLNNSSLSQISRENSGRGRNKSHMFKLGLDYYIDKQNTIGLSFNFRNGERSSTGINLNKEYDLSGNIVSDYFSTSNDNSKGYNFDISTNYMLRFKTPQQVLSAEFTYSRDKDDETENNFDTYIAPVNSTPEMRNEISNEKRDQFRGQIDYVHPISKNITVETGYRGNYDKRDNDFAVDTFDYRQNQFVRDNNLTNRFIYRQGVNALYGIYMQQLGNFGFSLGARVEHTYVKGELVTSNQVFNRNYIDFFPSASISQKLSKSTEIQLSYARRINRPRGRQLNPFRSQMGTNNYSEGNPQLNPEFTDAMELSFIQYFKFATITPSIFYRYTKDEISRQRTLLDTISTLSTFVNLNKSKSYGGELIITSQPAKFINFNGTFSFYRSEIDASNLQSGLTNAANIWSARGMSTITLPADLSLQMSYFYSGKRVTSNGTIDPFQSFDAAIKKNLFDKKLSLTLRATDIFNTSKFRYNFDDIDFRETSERVRDSRGLFLNITYKFGEQDKKKTREKKRDENEGPENEDIDY